MKYLIPLLIALCFILLLGFTRDLATEVSELREGYKVLSEENNALWDYIWMVDDKTDRIERAQEETFKPFSHIIPISGGFLGIREEKDANKN